MHFCNFLDILLGANTAWTGAKNFRVLFTLIQAMCQKLNLSRLNAFQRSDVWEIHTTQLLCSAVLISALFLNLHIQVSYHLRFSFSPRNAPFRELTELNPNSDLDWHTLSLYPLFQMPGPREQHDKEGGTPGENPQTHIHTHNIYVHNRSLNLQNKSNQQTKTEPGQLISRFLLRLLQGRLPGSAACSGPSHHAPSQQHCFLRPAGTDQSGHVPVSLPPIYIWRLHLGHSEPTALVTRAQLHLYFPQHCASRGAGEGEEAQGVSVCFICGCSKSRRSNLSLPSFFWHFRSTWGWWVSTTGSTGLPGSSCSSSSSPFQCFLSPCSSVFRSVCVTWCHISAHKAALPLPIFVINNRLSALSKGVLAVECVLLLELVLNFKSTTFQWDVLIQFAFNSTLISCIFS